MFVPAVGRADRGPPGPCPMPPRVPARVGVRVWSSASPVGTACRGPQQCVPGGAAGGRLGQEVASGREPHPGASLAPARPCPCGLQAAEAALPFTHPYLEQGHGRFVSDVRSSAA